MKGHCDVRMRDIFEDNFLMPPWFMAIFLCERWEERSSQ